MRNSGVKLLSLLSFSVLTACSHNNIKPEDNIHAACAAKKVTTINGQPVPGELMRLQDNSEMLDTIDSEGKRLIITKGTRKAGTRVGIHIHKYGGHTCVLSGAIVDFVEGQKGKKRKDGGMEFKAGSCYYMPPNTYMSAANLGEEDAVLIDTFNLPVGEDPISICEPGY